MLRDVSPACAPAVLVMVKPDRYLVGHGLLNADIRRDIMSASARTVVGTTCMRYLLGSQIAWHQRSFSTADVAANARGCIASLAPPSFMSAVQAAGRRVAYHTFSHVLDLDISFHLERRTGALSRVLERGARGCHCARSAAVKRACAMLL